MQKYTNDATFSGVESARQFRESVGERDGLFCGPLPTCSHGLLIHPTVAIENSRLWISEA